MRISFLTFEILSLLLMTARTKRTRLSSFDHCEVSWSER